MPGSDALIIRDLGQVDYTSTWQRMQQFTDQRDDSTIDEIWLLEHPPGIYPGPGR